MRWVEKKVLELKVEKLSFNGLNESTMRKVLNPKAVMEMIDNLPKIPGFRLTLSDEEKDVIAQ